MSFENKHQDLIKKLAVYTSHLSRMIEVCRLAMQNFDEKELRHLTDTLENEIDRFEIETDQECINILALYHPEARGLRSIVMILKINNDLERIGDLITDAAYLILKIGGNSESLYVESRSLELLDMVKEMFEMTLSAFFENKKEIAYKIIEETDDRIDSLRTEIIDSEIARISAGAVPLEVHFSLISIVRKFERIADLCENIAEDIIYMLEGNVTKHQEIDS